MTALDRFAKARTLHDRTDNPHERRVAAAKMKTLARDAGMTVAQAKRKLDAPPVVTRAQAAASAFNDFFNSPEMRAQFARQDAERQLRRAQILAEFGSVEAVYAETEREAALREACAPFTVLDGRPDYEGCYTLNGWRYPDSDTKIPAPVMDAVKRGWPMPSTVRDAWAEYEACEGLARNRHAMHDYEYWPELWVSVRKAILKTLLATLPAASIGDMLARQSWIEAELEFDVVDQTVLATLRADIKRMGERLRDQEARDAA